MSLPKPSNQAAVVITGASSGIGTELAGGLARRGYPLVLVARRRERLDELADELRTQYSVGVDVMPLDLGDAGCREQLAERLRSEPIAGLCNSAGFGTSGVFHTLPVERESEQITLNALALMELTHAALPGMVDRGAGAVLNIASIAAFQPLPGMAVYSATQGLRPDLLGSRPRGAARNGGLVHGLVSGPGADRVGTDRRRRTRKHAASRKSRRTTLLKPRSRGCSTVSAAWCPGWCRRWPASAVGSHRAVCCCPPCGSAGNCAARRARPAPPKTLGSGKLPVT